MTGESSSLMTGCAARGVSRMEGTRPSIKADAQSDIARTFLISIEPLRYLAIRLYQLRATSRPNVPVAGQARGTVIQRAHAAHVSHAAMLTLAQAGWPRDRPTRASAPAARTHIP